MLQVEILAPALPHLCNFSSRVIGVIRPGTKFVLPEAETRAVKYGRTFTYTDSYIKSHEHIFIQNEILRRRNL